MNARLAVRVIVVADIDASARFYERVFGFTRTEFFEGGGAVLSAVTQQDDVWLRAQMMRDAAGIVIELVQFVRPVTSHPRHTDDLAHYGYTHIAFFVDDVDATRALALAAGGAAMDQTRVSGAVNGLTLDGMYVTDPDGLRIEILAVPGAPAQYLWNGVCVHDMERSIAYYRCLGFEPAESFDHSGAPEWVGTLNGIPGLRLVGQIVRDAHGVALELIHILSPAPAGDGTPRDYTRYGLANLAYFCADRDAVGARLLAAGGTMFPATRVNIGDLKQWHGLDPDGARLELVQHPSPAVDA